MTADLAVFGAGLVGLATAWRYLQRFPGSDVLVLEKERGVARHQSGHNSGVLHAGLAYAPGSAKARLAVRGLGQMLEFCREHRIAHQQCGKLVVATRPGEQARLHDLLARGTRNGLQGLTLLPAAAIAEYEPHARGLAALRVPEEGIADFVAVAECLARLIVGMGGRVVTLAPVIGLIRRGEWTLETGAGTFQARRLVNCAGLHADRIARMAGVTTSLRIVPFRGEYSALRPDRAHLVRHLIYPVAPPGLPFLGVHLTRRVTGVVEAGPNARLVLAREGYRGSASIMGDAREILGFSGLYRFALRHPRVVWQEVWQSASRRRFVAEAQRLVPELEAEDLVPAGSGVRAQAMLPDGRLVEDFRFEEQEGALHVLNAPSPAATASLAIGEEIAARLPSPARGRG